MITVTFTDAEVNLVRQALRAEHDRMVKQGYAGLAKVVDSARDSLTNAILDKNLVTKQTMLIANRNEFYRSANRTERQ